MPTRSDALPLMTFSSPLLSSVDRLLRGFESRLSLAGASSWLGRMDRFTDRFFASRLSSLGLLAGAPILGFQPRESEPMSLVPAESWIPSPTELRGQTASSNNRLPQAGVVPTARAAAARPSMPIVTPGRTPAIGSDTVAGVAPLTEPSRAGSVTDVAPTTARISAASAVPGSSPSSAASPLAPLATPGVDAASESPTATEPQVRDLVRVAASQQAVRESLPQATPRVSALGRAFLHLGFSDARLGLSNRDPLQSLFAAPSVDDSMSMVAPDGSRPMAARMAQAQAQSLAQVLVTPDAVPVQKKPAQSVAREAAAQVRESIHRPVGNPSVAESASAAAAASFVPSPSVALGSSHDAALTDSATAAAPAVTEPASLPSAVSGSDPAAPSASSGTTPRAVASPGRSRSARGTSMGTVVPSLWTPMSSALAPELVLGETAAAAYFAHLPTQDAVVLPSLSKPWSAPGSVGARSEQFTSRIGQPTQQIVPSKSAPQSFATWADAPGVPSQIGQLLAQHATSVARLPRSFDALVQTMDRGLSQSDSPRVVDRFVSPALPFVPPTESRQKSSEPTSSVSTARQPAAVPASNQTIRQTGPVSAAPGMASGPLSSTPRLSTPAAGLWAPSAEAVSAGSDPSVVESSHVRSLVADVPPQREQPSAEPASVFGRQARTATDASAAGPARPWLTPGGMATLAELFAAGVGLSSGGAQRQAESLGLSFVPSMVPSWLPLSASAGERQDLSAGSFVPVRERAAASLPYLPAESLSSSSLSPSAQATSLSSTTKSAPTRRDQPELTVRVGSSPITDRLSSEPAVAGLPALAAMMFGPSASPAREGASPAERGGNLLSQIGALGARSEVFAREHGVVRAEELASSLVSDAGSGFERFAAQVSANRFAPSSVPEAVRRQADAQVGRFDATLPALAGTAQRAESRPDGMPISSSSAALPFPGATALRSERLASQFAQSLLGATAGSANLWQGAPGLPSSIAAAVQQSQSVDTPSRWAMGPRGLLFVSEPLPTSLSQTAQTQPKPSQNRSAVAAKAASAVSIPAAGVSGIGSGSDALPQVSATGAAAPVEQAVAPRSVSAADVSHPVAASSRAAALPWQRLGGMGALAELFAASVGVGTGAAASIAQSLGVSAEGSFWPTWLSAISRSTGQPELPARFAAQLPSLTLPSTVEDQASKAQSPSETRRTSPRPLDAFVPAKSSFAPHSAAMLTGGLAATAESFAKQHGIERVAAVSERTMAPSQKAGSGDFAQEESAGRWVSVAGGLVFVPRDASATRDADATNRSLTTKQPTQAAKSTSDVARQSTLSQVPSNVAASSSLSSLSSLDLGRLGALGLRSELFSALLGPQSAHAGLLGGPRSGWEDIVSMLTSLPKAAQPSDADSSPTMPRWAWSGAGGLLYLGAPQRTSTGGVGPQAARDLASRDAGRPRQAEARGLSSVVAAQPGSLLSSLGSTQQLADRVSGRNQPTERGAEHIASPLLSLISAPALERDDRRGVGDVQRAFGSRLLTGFPRLAQRGDDSDSPTALWPKTMMQQVQRIEKVLSQLPVEWQPSTKVAAAVRQSGIALTPLWQELPRKLNQLKPYETVEPASARDSSSSASTDMAHVAAQRSPALSMVGPTAAPAEARREERGADSNKQQAVEKAMQDAVSSMIKSGGQAAASARLLEAIRAHSLPSPTRTDERMSLGDLSLIALSMGEQRIAASSPDHPKDRLEPNVSMALRMKKWKHVEDDKNSYRKAVTEHAEQVVKFMKNQMDQAKQRGQF